MLILDTADQRFARGSQRCIAMCGESHYDEQNVEARVPGGNHFIGAKTL